MVENYTRLFSMLPTEMKPDDKSVNFKTILGVYSEFADYVDEKNETYGNTLDIYEATGQRVDFIGALYAVFRNTNESDNDYRERIISTVIERKVPTSLPRLQEAVDSIVSSGRVYILENHQGKPCSVYLTGTADSDSTNKALKLVKRFLPAGVGLIVPVVAFDTWQNVKDQFPSWDSIGQDGYIW